MAEKEDLPSNESPSAERQDSEKESLFQFLARNPGAKIERVRLPKKPTETKKNRQN